jgi:predicted transcriptional regulator
MTGRHSSTHPVTELQQAILEFIWSKGPATAEEVREGLLPKHPLKDPSVRTLLRRLEERGYDKQYALDSAAKIRQGVMPLWYQYQATRTK